MAEPASKFIVLKYWIEDGVRFDIKGTLDGLGVFPDVPPAEIQEILIDAKDLSYITSTGIRRWMTWIWDMEKKCRTANITIEKCRPHFIKQIAIVNGFLPKKARVKSAFIEFCCETCDLVFQELIENQDERVKRVFQDTNRRVSFTAKCPDCRRSVELDLDPVKLFAFFSRD